MKAVLATVLASGGLVAVGQWGPLGAVDLPAPVAGKGGGREVSLLTGDRVVLDPRTKQVTPIAGKGRAGMRFSIRRFDGHVYVIPADAAALVGNGRIDRRLFDVAYLDKEGFDTRKQIPLIVQGGSGVRSLPSVADGVRALPSIGSDAVRIAKGDSGFWRSVAGTRGFGRGVQKIWLDARLRLLTDRSVPQIGAPEAWKAGYTGKGVKVAVLDSGIDATHPELAGQVAEAKNFIPDLEPDVVDHGGHGTHVAATVASRGDRYRGVAPDAKLLIGKVCTAGGMCDLSAVVKAMEWAAGEKHAKVVSMSMGGPDEPGVDPIEAAVNELTEKYGTLFVLGAGNDGAAGESSLASPASADAALAVGAVDRDDSVAPFSSMGPRRGDYALKPDVTAPGVGIVAARAKGTTHDPVDDTHDRASGTSQSTPHVSGAAALLFQQHPDWKAGQVKAALMASAQWTPGSSAYQQGAGRVDLAKAITQQVLPVQPSLSFGLALWPHNDDKPIVRKLTYRNTSDKDITLDLKVAAQSGPDGKPASTFTLSKNSLTVPAGGTASVEVTANTRGDGPDGSYTGRVLATGNGGVAVGTPVGVVKEIESYNLTVKTIGRDGKPASDYSLNVGGYDTVYAGMHSDPSGTVRVRAPRGHYNLSAEVATGKSAERNRDVIIAPWVDLSADRTITVDTRTAKPTPVTVERKDAAPVFGRLGFNAFGTDGGMAEFGFDHGPLADTRTAQIGPDAPDNRFLGTLHTALAVPGKDGTFKNSPYVYNLAYFIPGKPYTGPRKVRDAELAKVHSENLAQGKPAVGGKRSIAISTKIPGGVAPTPGLVVPMDLPATTEELYTTEGVAWITLLAQGMGDRPPEEAEVAQEARNRVYRAGRHYTERWNGGAVFGPSLPGPAWIASWAMSGVSRIRFDVPLFGQAADSAGMTKLDSLTTVVWRDGEKVYQTDEPGPVEVPNQKGRYRVSTQVSQSLTDTSTKVGAVWTFTHDGQRETPMPIQVVRFSPKLDAQNTAPGGRPYLVPLTVQRNPGAAGAKVKSLTVDVSYDDGAHWKKAPVVGGKVLLHHPGSGFVSLRAKATDTSENSVEQTIVRAYRLR